MTSTGESTRAQASGSAGSGSAGSGAAAGGSVGVGLVGGGTPSVEVRNLVKQFVERRDAAAFRAVDDVSLAIEEGEFFALLGPSGCGKTTTLRMIAGFEEPDSGEVILRGRSVTGIPAFHRPVNTVFQDFALFPHMTVTQNVLFGLRMAGTPATEAKRRAEEALEMVRLPHVGNRKPQALSGGQRQRVALARALVNRPAVLLLDEPLGALDLKLRKTMQFELKQLQQQVGITFIYVTHDQEEALTMADRIAVMSEGSVLQIGRPDDIYERPTSRFVADFIGETNFVDGTLAAKSGHLGEVRLPSGRRVTGVMRDTAVADGARAALAVRPEKLGITALSDDTVGSAATERPGRAGDLDETSLPGVISEVHYLGTDARYSVSIEEGISLVARVQNQHHGYDGMFTVGTPVRVSWRTEHGSVLA